MGGMARGRRPGAEARRRRATARKNNTADPSVVDIDTFFDPSRPGSTDLAPRLAIQYDPASAPLVPLPSAAGIGPLCLAGIAARRTPHRR